MMLEQRSAKRDHAVIIGGSLAGLMAARVLSSYFAQVTILERDPVANAPEARKGQPHTRHLHGLLAKGLEVFCHYFPDLPPGLVKHGALLMDMGAGIRWHIAGGYRVQQEVGMQGALMSRPLLEWQIRQRVLAIPNVQLIDQVDVEGPIFTADGGRVAGVRIVRRAQGRSLEEVAADLVVDASGRGSASPRWLAEAGYDDLVESVIKVHVGYATRLYRRRPEHDLGGDLLMVAAEPPHNRRTGLIFPIEGDRWIVTLGGWAGDHPPTDEEGFLAFARTLAVPDVYDAICRFEPLSEIIVHKFPSNLRRHYERMSRFPADYLVMGDAICSFNPVYGQGMTSAAMQAAALDEVMGRVTGPEQLAPAFFAAAAKIIDVPWQSAVAEDFRFRETVGKKPAGTDLINAYVTQVQRATHTDPVVYREFLKVMNMMQPPASLFKPGTVWRVIRANRRKQEPVTEMTPALETR
jgi:2-polyprenyl-6-methoxyphenol hydroxylase-like FAD-dependent oxidoreductase